MCALCSASACIIATHPLAGAGMARAGMAVATARAMYLANCIFAVCCESDLLETGVRLDVGWLESCAGRDARGVMRMLQILEIAWALNFAA